MDGDPELKNGNMWDSRRKLKGNFLALFCMNASEWVMTGCSPHPLLVNLFFVGSFCTRKPLFVLIQENTRSRGEFLHEFLLPMTLCETGEVITLAAGEARRAAYVHPHES